MDFSQWASASRARVESALAKAIDTRATPVVGRGDAVLHEAMGYAVLGGGKRIRALLVAAAGRAVNAPQAWCDEAGAAIECIHAFSLVHDDMPCMDDDELRRGQPTVHVRYGEAQALLVGDALQTLGFEIIAQMDAPAQTVVKLVQLLSSATGLAGMAGGQAVDIAAVGKSVSQPELEAMHALKTGALIRASVDMGAACGKAGDTEHQALSGYAARIGLAFQVADDVLDVMADAATLGKTPGKDAAANKPTFVGLLGLNGARDYARRLHQEAADLLEPLGQNAGMLRELARLLVERTH